MSFKIGFMSKHGGSGEKENTNAMTAKSVPRRSVVQVEFKNGASYSYYNDSFDLQRGDFVYVDGKLEGMLGRVAEVSCNFKIKPSMYKRVISLVDTEVHGRFYNAGSHVITFDRGTLPREKVRTWFFPPDGEEETVSGFDGESFPISELGKMKITPQIAERGHEYYTENRVAYLSLDGDSGYAIVEGSEPYEVEFRYQNGDISALVCSCFCTYNCKHEFAAMLQLKEALERIEKHYSAELERTGTFAEMVKGIFFEMAVDGSETSSFEI